MAALVSRWLSQRWHDFARWRVPVLDDWVFLAIVTSLLNVLTYSTLTNYQTIITLSLSLSLFFFLIKGAVEDASERDWRWERRTEDVICFF